VKQIPPTSLPAASPRAPRRRVDGVLLLDKPTGLSSNAVLQRAKRLYAAEKAGHTGTLDPLASGLLPLCFGDATKFAQALLDASKEYLATVRFGIATTTGDAEGEIVAERAPAFSAAEFEAVLPRFMGRIMQIPPRHAALKHLGRNYYEYARAGVEIPRAPREIEIKGIEVVAWAPPTAVLRVACSKGTYIRVLAEDLGTAVGSCAHLAGLRRTATGPFTLDRAATLEMLETMDVAARDALLLPIDAPLQEMFEITVDATSALALEQGRLAEMHGNAMGRYRCYGPGGRFLGIVEAGGGALRPIRLARTDARPED
jgi:tRNA pseudouridine55 synthase